MALDTVDVVSLRMLLWVKITSIAYPIGLAVAYAVKKQWVQKRIGKNPFILSSSQSTAEGYLKKTAFLFFPLWLGGMGVHAFWPHLLNRWSHFQPPAIVMGTGLFLFAVSFALFIAALVHLREAWRFGIDREQTSLLITNGVYGFIRHPIYTSLKLAQCATLLLFPNLYFLVIILPAFLGFTMIALLEEDFLLQNFGQKYRDYMARTGRFYPRLFRN